MLKTPPASCPGVSKRMRAAKTSGTEPELAVRKLLFSDGLRYRVQYRVVGLNRRTIDIAFPREQLAVFIDGCFWHGCTVHRTIPKSNNEWWKQKIDGNRERDRDTVALLKRLGWRVLRFWEHENPVIVLAQIKKVLNTQHRHFSGPVLPGRKANRCG